MRFLCRLKSDSLHALTNMKALSKVLKWMFKALWDLIKTYALFFAGKKRVLDVRKKSDAVIVLQRMLDRGIITPGVLRNQMAKQSEKDMRKQVRKAFKKGRKITVDDLVGTIKEDPSFIEFCEDIGLSMNFFVGLAEKMIKEYQQAC